MITPTMKMKLMNKPQKPNNMENLELTNDQKLRLAIFNVCCDTDEAREAYAFITEGNEKPAEEPAPEILLDDRFETKTATTGGQLQLFVVNPSSLKCVPYKEWLERSDRKEAEWVAIRNEDGLLFYLHKKEANDGKDLKFDEIPGAIEAMKLFQWTGFEDSVGRRKWWCDVYDAIHTKGLNDLLKEIGGDPIRDKWYWTADKDTDPSYSSYAWIFCGGGGGLTYPNGRLHAVGARVFRAF